MRATCSDLSVIKYSWNSPVGLIAGTKHSQMQLLTNPESCERGGWRVGRVVDTGCPSSWCCLNACQMWLQEKAVNVTSLVYRVMFCAIVVVNTIRCEADRYIKYHLQKSKSHMYDTSWCQNGDTNFIFYVVPALMDEQLDVTWDDVLFKASSENSVKMPHCYSLVSTKEGYWLAEIWTGSWRVT